jgi:predicted Zn-dependent protease
MQARTLILRGALLLLSACLTLVSPPDAYARHKNQTNPGTAPAEAASEDPGCHDCIARAATLFATGNSVDAAALLDSWRLKCPKNAQLRILLSTILIRTKTQTQEAESVAREAVELAPKSLAARMQYALSSMINGKSVQAQQQFEMVVQLDPGNYEAWSALGSLYSQLRDEQKSAAAQQKAAALEPSVQTSRLRQLRNLAKSSKPGALSNELHQLIAANDNQPEALSLIAQQAADLGAYDSALTAAERALIAYPQSFSALKVKATAQLFLDDPDGAANLASDLLRKDKSNADIYAVRSIAGAMLDQQENSRADLESAQRLQPKGAMTNLAAAHRALLEGRLKDAATALQAVLQARSTVGDSPIAHLYLARVFLKELKPVDAEAEAHEAARGPGLQAASLALEARVKLMSGDRESIDAAETLAQRAARLNPDQSDCLLAGAAIALHNDRPELAADKANRVAAKESGNADAIFILCEVERLKGNGAQQSKLLQRCLAIAPNDPDVCLALGRLRLAEGDAAQSKTLCEKALAVRQDNPEVNYYLAQALEKQGERDESIKFYKLCLSLGITGQERNSAAEAIKRLQSATAQP